MSSVIACDSLQAGNRKEG
uniref:Uncharacterized protein n=1 Tax=Anguilla anguilla TaxID=7936 RepID=A0A0E9V2S0_ANGAN